MEHAPRPVVWLVALALLAGAPACRSDSGAGDPASAGVDATAEREAPEATARPPRLREVRVVDTTPPEARSDDLSLPVEQTVKDALRAQDTFGHAPEDGSSACVAEVLVMYALTVNGEVVPDADEGEARMAIEGNVHCPLPDDPDRDGESFRAIVEGEREYGPGHAVGAAEALQGLLAELAPQAAGRVYGQAVVRHASDTRILDVLAHEERPGLLMEAASEAGERKLVEAVPHLARLASHEDEVVALRAGAALGLIGEGDAEVLRALAKMTEGSDAERHLVAIHALGDIGGEEAARYLDTIAVGHPMVPIRDAARRAADRARAHADGP